jgi:hypothetical protein
MNDHDKVQQFIIKATGKSVGRNKKIELSTMFANAYMEYVKMFNQVNQGYKILKEEEKILKAVRDQRDYYLKLYRSRT